MSQLTKEQVLAAPAKLREVKVPEWGGSGFIRPVTLDERGRLANLGGLRGKSPASAFLLLQDAVLKFSRLTEESPRELGKNLLTE